MPFKDSTGMIETKCINTSTDYSLPSMENFEFLEFEEIPGKRTNTCPIRQMGLVEFNIRFS